MKTNLLRLVLPLAALGFIAAGTASAQTAIPGGTHSATYVITKPGSYYLAGNRTMSNLSNHAIEIKAADVTLDLRGHTLSFSGENATGNGVHIGATENVAVHSGAIVSANIGVSSGSGSMLKLNDLRIVGGQSGIVSSTYNTSIMGCQIADVSSYGIHAVFGTILIKDCTIDLAGLTGIRSVTARIENVNVTRCTRGLELSASELSNSRVSDSTEVGVVAGMNTTLRNNFITSCKQTAVMVGGIRVTLLDNIIVDTKMMNSVWRGIYSQTYSFLAIGNRMTGNGNNVVGPMVDGGGNTIW